MSSAQPITIDEQEHYIATRQVKRGTYHMPAKHRARKLDQPAVSRTLATFGTPTNLPGFLHPIGSKVRTTNGSAEWTVVSQAETPAGTSPRSYRISAGKLEKVLGENALRPIEEHKKMTVIDVRLNRSTGQIEPVSPKVGAGRSLAGHSLNAIAKTELKSMLVASVAPTLAPSIDEPALFTVEPMTSRFTQVTSWTKIGGSSAKPTDHKVLDRVSITRVPNGSSSLAPKIRLNAPFAPTAVVTVLVAENPKKVGSGSHKRFALYVSGQTIAQTLASGVTIADVKWDAAHDFIKVATNQD